MICCEKCFTDIVIKSEIIGLGNKGNCEICGSRDVYIYDSEYNFDDSNIEEWLTSIVKIYKAQEKLDENYPKEHLGSLENKLKYDWDIFDVDETKIRTIIGSIINNALDIDTELLEQKVGIPELNNTDYMMQNSIMGVHKWDDFRKYLRSENRFHSKYISLDILSEILKDTEIIIPEGTILYRARKSSRKGFKRKSMGAPPSELATAGRANSKGISCLYLCSQKNTTVKEIRANIFDYVTIANFRVNRNIKVLDMSSICHNSPFFVETDKVKYLVNEKHLRKMQDDLAKPITSDDTELDYLPTQYISDFAKYLGYDGVKYMSTFDKNAYNLALFDVKSCTCTYNRNYLIGNSDYKLTNGHV